MTKLTFAGSPVFLTTIFCVLLGLLARAQAPGKISLDMKNAPLTAVLAAIEKQTGTPFIYNRQQVEKVQVASASYQQKNLTEVLNHLLGQYQFGYKLEGGNIILFPQVKKEEKKPAAAPGKVTGKIIDEENGQPVVGATIRIGGRGITSDMDGSFSLSLPDGSYIATVSYVGYGTKEVSEIDVKNNTDFALNVTLKRKKGQLAAVVVKASARKESIAALYTTQKNAASMTNGISAEQIARTPDNNMGQVLKRVSGVSTIDNRYVIVRGLSERYNQAMIDGVIIPSTDMNRRNFSFDAVPAELVSNVVVNKTATPDMSAEFSGGQISVNTLDLPNADFFSVSVGVGINDLTQGKKLMNAGGRGKYDYLGFDDGRRKAPSGLNDWNWQSWIATGGGSPNRPPDFAVPQSHQFRAESFKLYNYNAAPNQNYRVAFGKLFNGKDQTRFGITGAVTYRNTQEINEFRSARREIGGTLQTEPNLIDDPVKGGHGTINKFNTTLGGLLNIGYQSGKTKLTFKNLYTRIFSDNLFQSYAYNSDNSEGMQRTMEYLADPETVSVLQHKLEGEHTLSKTGLVLNWNLSMTNIRQENTDRRQFRYFEVTDAFGNLYYQRPSTGFLGASGKRDRPDQRMWTEVREKDYNWNVSLSQSFDFLKDKTTLKAGYSGWHKKRNLDAMYALPWGDGEGYLPYEVLLKDHIGNGEGMAYYYINSDARGSVFEGTANYHGAYLMADQRLFKKLRLVYGVRAENFDLSNRQDEWVKIQRGAQITGYPPLTGEKNWRFLPSANLTYNLTATVNLRAAWSKTMVRPDFRETSYFIMYDPYLDDGVSGWDVQSTKIQNYDLRAEWYPSAGEIIGFSAFYKDFDKPLELSFYESGYRFQNQRSAKVKGLELEFRKSLGFVASKKWLRNLSLFGNGTIMESRVHAIRYFPSIGDSLVMVDMPVQKRPLYGQSNYLINGGISYESSLFSANVVYNRSGPRVFTIAGDPNQVEYENGRHLIDAQVSVKLLKQKAEIKLNMSNLLNAATMFYINAHQYLEQDANGNYINPKGTSKYEPKYGDAIKYRIYNGRTFNLSFNYKF